MYKCLRTASRVFVICTAIVFIVIYAGCSGKSNTVNETNTVTVNNDVSTTSNPITQTDEGKNDMLIVSKAFKDGERIPFKYANKGVTGGQNISIPLQWENIPKNSKSFALSMIDVSANNWVHWMVLNIPASSDEISEGASLTAMTPGSSELNNTFGTKGYGGPQPPTGSGDHVYLITIYALNADNIKMSEQPTADEFVRDLEGSVIGQASIKGVFNR